MSNTIFRTDSGRIPPNQQEIYENLPFTNEENYSQNTNSFVTAISEPINDLPSAYDEITQAECVQVPKNTNIDANYLSYRIAQEF
ncbi:14944_t:CDS:2 [Cetraspora pellucida]|uniref:14944_t:CDS:1 n=1 Tax=Cetraspora pellucida TaxID=1433469 RepID=A0A9N9P398_9GLOM|nr:14944_t:CDS:2 [Cetraspora pellucida]